MAIDQPRKQRLKPLLDKVPSGFVVDTRWLKAQGIDAKSIHGYVSRGWLERVTRGVYRRPVPEGVERVSEVSWETALLSLQRIMEHDLHLGGETALEMAGYSHYLRLGGRTHVHFYGSAPAWLRRIPTRTKIVVHRRSLFGDDPAGIGDSSRDVRETGLAVNVWRWPIRTSGDERAILEALDELPNKASFDSLGKVFEALTTLRPELLTTLLAKCRSVKVRRLFFVFADRYRHPWRRYVDTSKIYLGSGPRALVKGGVLHPKYRIYVPDEFARRGEEGAGVDG